MQWSYNAPYNAVEDGLKSLEVLFEVLEDSLSSCRGQKLTFDDLSWWYNYLPVPEATFHNKWWCMFPDETPFTPPARPEGEER